MMQSLFYGKVSGMAKPMRKLVHISYKNEGKLRKIAQNLENCAKINNLT